jgi:uncharacterized protein (TIRG00374 family)
MKITKYLGLVGIILFVYIISKVNLNQVINIFSSANPFFIALSIVPLFFVIVLRSLRWKVIINATGFDISLKDCFLIWLKGYFLGGVTPGRVGDLFRAKFLTDKIGISLGKSLMAAVVDRVFDILVIFGLSALGILMILQLFGIAVFSLCNLFILLVVFGLCLYILTIRKLTAKILSPLFNLFVPSKFKEKTKIDFDEFYKGLDLLKERKRHLFASISVGILSWLVAGYGCYMLALSLSLNISYWYVLISVAISSLIALLPISISGLGTREATFIFLFSIINIVPEEAVSFSLLILAWTWLPILSGICVLYLFKK